MTNFTKILSTTVLLAGLASCAIPRPSAGGAFIYTNAIEGEFADSSVQISKTGQSCATNILGIASTGDATLETAKRSSNIKNVGSIDRSYYNILGVYAKACTIVKGN